MAHYPTGTSKWNPVEHRLFSEISKNWAGEPLRDYETLLNFARKTTTSSGLTVEVYHDKQEYKKGQTVSDKEMGALAVRTRRTIGTVELYDPSENPATDQQENRPDEWDLEKVNSADEWSYNNHELAFA